MEIVNRSSATLCNFEVMKMLQKIKDTRQKQKGQLPTITYETLRYLESTPCGKQTEASISGCLKDLREYNLSETEKLMMINNPPTTPLEIQLMVDESEERLTETQVQEILDIVLRHFPHIQKEKKDENAETTE